MRNPRLLLVSGIPPSHWGTGRLVSHIEGEVQKRRLQCDLLAKPERPPRNPSRTRWLMDSAVLATQRLGFRARLSRACADSSRPLLILHPQTLGFQLTMNLVERRKVPTALFLLDSSFFCIVSYNHVRDEPGPCVRCMGGRFFEASANRCTPFPKPDPQAMSFVERLRGYVAEGRVVLIAQTRRQAELASRHFGLTSMPDVVGLWTADWNEALWSSAATPAAPSEWDVVYHGFNVAAKGAAWLESLAARLSSWRFLFPYAAPRKSGSSNCDYRPMTWESGLEGAVRSSRITVVPSLWSAPIEGALVKSVAVARATAVVENPSSYSDELPEGLILRLPADPDAAAGVLDRALRSGWAPDAGIKGAWLEQFRGERDRFMDRLVAAVPGMDARFG